MPRPAPSMRSSRTARASSPPSMRCWRARSARTTIAAVGQIEMFGGGRRAPIRLRSAASSHGCRRSGCRREYDAVGFFLSGHPLDDYGAVLKRMRVQSWAEFARAVRGGASAGRVAGDGGRAHGAAHQTGSKMGIIGLSDPTGHYEAVIFSEGLAQFRDLLEPGAAVLLMLSGGAAGRRRARAHPDRSSRSTRRRRKLPEGHARLPARRGADRERREAAREPAARGERQGRGRRWC